jgi:hypothetical protein
MAAQYGEKDSEIASSGGQYYIIGRVLTIVLGPYLDNSLTPNPNYSTPADIGKITYELLYSSRNITSGDSGIKPAYPISSFTKQYPLIGEVVLILTGPSPGLNDNFNNQTSYYFPPYNIWNAVNHNVFPNLNDYYNFLSKFAQKPTYQGQSSLGNVEMPKGYTFSEMGWRLLTPFEGDSIIEGRYGQSIRFSSTISNFNSANPWSNSGENGSPITIIRNGQGDVVDPLNKFASTVEDINTDKASIYLTSGQEIVLEDINNFPKDSYGIVVNNTQQTIISIYNKPVSNDSIDAATQDKNALG